MPGVVNSHVHLPPNASAFATPEAAAEAAAAEGVRVLGASNFHDLRVYRRFAVAAEGRGLAPLFGLEVIGLDEELREAGIRVNDPANAGRVYVCGKGIDPFHAPGDAGRAIAAAARAADEARAREMMSRLRNHLSEAGLEMDLDEAALAAEVAGRAGVPADWVVLQERHIATAAQEALFREVAPAARGALLARAYGAPPAAPVEDAVAVQAELRSRLLKAGRPGFVPEAAVPLADARRLVLEHGGIPCHPTLADGASPVCPWEAPPDRLAERLAAGGIPAAELIPNRNDPGTVEAYAAAFRARGLIVMAGTEHNTPEPIPLAPRCRDGSRPSPRTRALFREGTMVALAHQHQRAAGGTGFVDAAGRPAGGFPDHEARIRWFRELGEELVRAGAAA